MRHPGYSIVLMNFVSVYFAEEVPWLASLLQIAVRFPSYHIIHGQISGMFSDYDIERHQT